MKINVGGVFFHVLLWIVALVTIPGWLAILFLLRLPTPRLQLMIIVMASAFIGAIVRHAVQVFKGEIPMTLLSRLSIAFLLAILFGLTSGILILGVTSVTPLDFKDDAQFFGSEMCFAAIGLGVGWFLEDAERFLRSLLRRKLRNQFGDGKADQHDTQERKQESSNEL